MDRLKDKTEALLFFTEQIRENRPFGFTKFGDTELFCIDRKQGTGGEQFYSPEAAEDLVAAYDFLRKDIHLGDWTWNAQREKRDLIRLTGPIQRSVFYDVFLFHDNSYINESLKDFYRAIRESNRYKIYVAGEHLAKGKDFLKADVFISVPNRDAYAEKIRIILDLVRDIPEDKPIMVLTSCSIMAKIIGHYVRERDPYAFFIDLGSALDPLFIGNTRAQEADNSERAKKLFEDML